MYIAEKNMLKLRITGFAWLSCKMMKTSTYAKGNNRIWQIPNMYQICGSFTKYLFLATLL